MASAAAMIVLAPPAAARSTAAGAEDTADAVLALPLGEAPGRGGCSPAMPNLACRTDFAENRFHFSARCSKLTPNASAAP